MNQQGSDSRTETGMDESRDMDLKGRGADMDNNTTVNIGEQRFDILREEDRFYIDKTGFVKEWWENGSTVTLITRPRRFGKTLNMSMFECFFSNKYADRGDLFEGLSIWDEKSPSGDYRYRKLQGTYPVVFMSFAGIKAGNITDMKAAVKTVIANVYGAYREIVNSEKFDRNDRESFAAVNERMDGWMTSRRTQPFIRYVSIWKGILAKV